MKLNRSVLSCAMFLALAIPGCNDKVNLEPGTGGAAPAVSDSDSTADTAPTAPPAPQADPQGSAPGPNHVWVAGSWRYLGGHYRWVGGRWEPERPGFILVQSRWEEEHGRWLFHPSRWAHGADRPNEHGSEHDRRH